MKEADKDRDLEDFIQNDAQRHFLDRKAVTYGLFSDQIAYPLGFSTLQNDAIVVDDTPLPEVSEYTYKSFPAVKLGRFAIRIDHQKERLGALFFWMLKELMCNSNRTGCRFIIVDARRDKANKVNVIPFYEKNGFTLLPQRTATSTYKPMYFDPARLPREVV